MQIAYFINNIDNIDRLLIDMDRDKARRTAACFDTWSIVYARIALYPWFVECSIYYAARNFHLSSDIESLAVFFEERSLAISDDRSFADRRFCRNGLAIVIRHPCVVFVTLLTKSLGLW